MNTIGLAEGVVEVRSYHEAWAGLGEAERRRVADALGDLAVSVEHVGSTSVPGLPAKPIVDIAVALRDDGTAEEDLIRQHMAAAGYEEGGRASDGGGWIFRRGPAERRVAHVHLVAIDDPEWERYLIFREALRLDPAGRQRYGDFKCRLAELYPNDRVAYTGAKAKMVEEVIALYRYRQAGHRPDLVNDRAEELPEIPPQLAAAAMTILREWNPLEVPDLPDDEYDDVLALTSPLLLSGASQDELADRLQAIMTVRFALQPTAASIADTAQKLVDCARCRDY